MKKRTRILIALLIVCILMNGNATAFTLAKQAGILKLNYSTLTMYTGSKKNLEVTKNTTGSKPTYVSSDISIASISKKGQISAKKEGSAIITVKAGKISARCVLTVRTKIIEVKKIVFSMNDGYRVLDLGQTLTNSATVIPSNAANKKITYTSSDSSIVSVDQNGSITGRSPGEGKITATASNGVKAVSEVEVTEYPYVDMTEKIPEEKDSTLYLKQGSVNIGQSIATLKTNLGEPNRIDANEFGCETFVYNSDYSSLVFVYVDQGVVVGYFTNAVSFQCAGVSNTSTLDYVYEVSSGGTGWTVPDKYTVMVDDNCYGDRGLMSLFLTSPYMDQGWGADPYLANASSALVHTMEIEAFDLLNGFRVREGVMPVTLDTLAEEVCRNHSQDMLTRGYADHVTPEGVTPHQRLKNAGVLTRNTGEIIAPWTGGVAENVAGFMGSAPHREILLNNVVEYAGPGIALGKDDSNWGYLTIALFYK